VVDYQCLPWKPEVSQGFPTDSAAANQLHINGNIVESKHLSH